MRVCSKCGEEKADALFVWFDGILYGEAKRCLTCRSPAAKARARRLPPDVPDPRFMIRRHAVARFHERVRPDLRGYLACLFEMIRLMEHAPFQTEPPDWYKVGTYEGYYSFQRGYLMVSPDIAFPLSAYGGEWSSRRVPVEQRKPETTMVGTVLTRVPLVPASGPEDWPAWVAQINRGVELRRAQSEAYRQAKREANSLSRTL